MEYKYKAPRQIDGFFHDQQKVRWGYVRRRQTELFGEVRKKNRLQTKDILTSDDGAQLVVEPLKKKLGFFERIKGYLPCQDEEGHTGYLQVVERSVVRIALLLVVLLLVLATSFYLLFQAARPADDTPIRIASGEMYNPNPENIRLPGITEVHAQAGSTRVSQLLLNVEGNAYNLTYSEGTHLTLAGAGYGRSDSSALDAKTVASDGIKGTVRSGESSLFAMQNLNGAKTLITMAEATPGSAQAQSGDSGGGMFAQFENEWYLVGTITGVSPNISTSTAIFGSYGEASLTYGSDGRPNGVDKSALLENSLTIATSLEDYAETISSIIATNPIPEPLESAILSGAGAFALAIAARRRRK